VPSNNILVGKTLPKLSLSEHVMPQQIRVSVGTAIVLGLLEGKLDAEPTTAYLMTHHAGKCIANCGFCPQAKNSQSKAELLSRVSWPAFSTQTVLEHLGNAAASGRIRRVCIQALNYPEVFEEVCSFVTALKRHISVSVSVSCQPLNSPNMWSLSRAGVDRIGIALDAATPKLFDKVKGKSAGGPYRWEEEFVLLRMALGVFGEGNVSTHLIVGLGETEREAVKFLQQLVDMGVLPGLFTFTPIRGTALADRAKPQLESYRRIQVARYLIVHGLARVDDMEFSTDGELLGFGVDTHLLLNLICTGKPFETAGCKDCNRPFYNEKPSGPIYNYPRNLTEQEILVIKKELKPQIE
jgi:biotin synthase